MKTLQLYSYEELNDAAKETALKQMQQSLSEDSYLLDYLYSDLRETLEAIVKGFGFKLIDYRYGLYDQGSRVHVSGYEDHLYGNKAIAHVLRILMEHGYKRPAKFSEMKFNGQCGFTGLCYDDDILEGLWESLMDGNSIRTAFDHISQTLCKICESEYEYQTNEDNARDQCRNRDEEYTDEGILI